MQSSQKLTRADFARIGQSKVHQVHGKYFYLIVSLHSTGVQPPKFACVVSKKVAKKATERNLLKRRCREAVRIALTKSVHAGTLVFYAKKSATNVSFDGIRNDIAELIARVR